ncbi:hypothetical protein FB451DRAFT_1564296 [Mycena latifolia]|nr:hypothetical protein FB451DRAFT_1564296 [Mycena latifolia]
MSPCHEGVDGAQDGPEAHPPPPTPSPTPPATQLTRNGTVTRRAGPPALPPPDVDFDFDFRRAPTEGSPPGTPDSYRTACDTPAALGTCNACGHRAAYVDYAESPGVVPAGGALANAANQGGLDALEEVRLLKDQVRDVSRVCNAVATGDLTQNIIVPVQGDLMVQLKKLRASFLPLASDWRALRAAAKRALRRPLPLLPISLIAAVTTAVAKGDLSKQIKVRFSPLSFPPSTRSLCARSSRSLVPPRALTLPVSANGEILDLKNTVNGMVFRLRTLAVGVTRVSLEPSLEIGRRRTASSEEASSHLRMPSTVDALRVFCFCGEKGVMRLMRFFNDALLRREKSERCAAPSLLSSHASRHLRDAIRARDCKLGGEASVSDVIWTPANAWCVVRVRLVMGCARVWTLQSGQRKRGSYVRVRNQCGPARADIRLRTLPFIP